MKTYRTAQGKMVDMAALAARNERMRAVGNMSVNARGDTIDGEGRIVVPVTDKVGEQYQATVGNKSAHVRVAQQAPSQTYQQAEVAQPAPVVVETQAKTPEELDLDASFSEDIEIEQIKAKQTKGKK